ncbi:MAG TPA: hypothetical protein DHW02_08405 [Ktedonobacter sp.]|nr:hypothetical protein [Ktedonobacter sp.]
MTFDELVSYLRAKGVKIYDEGDKFRLQAPQGIISPQILEIITQYSADLLYLVRLGDVRVCPERTAHRDSWRYSQAAHAFVCKMCRKEEKAA